MKLVPYVIGECLLCKKFVTGHLLRGRQPEPRFHPKGVVVVSMTGSRHLVQYPVDAMERGLQVKPRGINCRKR
jgi:hypothetical protein